MNDPINVVIAVIGGLVIGAVFIALAIKLK